MTEIPEHLLRRSRERRAALGGGEDSAATEAAAAVASEAPKSSAPVPARTPATQVAGGGGATPVATMPSVSQEREAEPVARYGATRVKTPWWILPVLAALPLWGVVYLGAFGNRTKAAANDPVVRGAALFTANCASCHGSNGEGGVGPQLNSGEVLKEWPKLADHLAWVHTGGAPFVGKTIGALNIPVPANNIMPAFGTANGGSLSDQQIADVVCYERVSLGGGPENPSNCPATG